MKKSLLTIISFSSVVSLGQSSTASSREAYEFAVPETIKKVASFNTFVGIAGEYTESMTPEAWAAPGVKHFSNLLDETQLSSTPTLAKAELESVRLGRISFDRLLENWGSLFSTYKAATDAIAEIRNQIEIQSAAEGHSQALFRAAEDRKKQLESEQAALEYLLKTKEESASQSIQARFDSGAITGKKLKALQSSKVTLGLGDFTDESITRAQERVRKESEEIAELKVRITSLTENISALTSKIEANKTRLKADSDLLEQEKGKFSGLEKATADKIGRIEGRRESGRDSEIAAGRAFVAAFRALDTESFVALLADAERLLGVRQSELEGGASSMGTPSLPSSGTPKKGLMLRLFGGGSDGAGGGSSPV